MNYNYETIDFQALEAYEEKLHQKADADYPDMEDRYCPYCGRRLVRGSISYFEGYHIDSCY